MSLLRVFLLIAVLCSSANCNVLRATVEFADLPSSLPRTCRLPENLTVTITTEIETILLKLTRSKGVDSSAQVFVIRKNRNGAPTFVKENNLREKNSMLYLADTNDAEFALSCNKAKFLSDALTLVGTLDLSNGKMYSLEKSSNTYTMIEEDVDTLLAESTQLNDEMEAHENSRPKRAVAAPIQTDVFIDVLALIEHSVYERFYSRAIGTTPESKRAETIDTIRRHFAHIFNAVDRRFKTASEKINIILTGFIIEDEVSGEWFEDVRNQERNKSIINAANILDSQYLYSLNEGFPEHDHLISFTSVNLYWTGTGGIADIAGLATVGQICSYFAQSVSTCEFQDTFIVDVRIAAHEIGHSLGSSHDGAGNTCDTYANNVMSGTPKRYQNTNPFYFSTCSAAAFATHINRLLNQGPALSTDCLTKALKTNSVPDVSDEILGQKYDVDKQCQQAHGPESYHCRVHDISDTSVCLKMYCYNPEAGYCYQRYAAKGTTCGDGKWCDAGECVNATEAPSADPTCLFGDQIGSISNTGQNCSQYATKARCVSNYHRRYCCKTCKQLDGKATSTPSPTTTEAPTPPSTTRVFTPSTSTTASTTTSEAPKSSSTAKSTSPSPTTKAPTTSPTTTKATATSSTTTKATTTSPTTEVPTSPQVQLPCANAPVIPNTEVTVSGNTATYKCKEGFGTRGGQRSVATCQNDVWSQTNLQCIDVSECYIMNGRNRVYSGPLSTTNRGYTCKNWDDPSLDRYRIQDSHFSAAGGDDSTPTKAEQRNYCRDPSGVGRWPKGRLWCFVTEPGATWDFCDDVPVCNTTVPSCPDPPVVANADLTIADTKATYKCREGFAIKNPYSTTSTCLAGVWSPVGLQCVDVSSCYVRSGRMLVYSGTLSTTNEGYECQRWDSQTPNWHRVQDYNFRIAAGYDPTPTKTESENYCRDPYGGGRLWCITNDPNKRLDYCDAVKECGTEVSFG